MENISQKEVEELKTLFKLVEQRATVRQAQRYATATLTGVAAVACSRALGDKWAMILGSGAAVVTFCYLLGIYFEARGDWDRKQLRSFFKSLREKERE